TSVAFTNNHQCITYNQYNNQYMNSNQKLYILTIVSQIRRSSIVNKHGINLVVVSCQQFITLSIKFFNQKISSSDEIKLKQFGQNAHRAGIEKTARNCVG